MLGDELVGNADGQDVGTTVPPMTPDVPAVFTPNELDDPGPLPVTRSTLSNKGILVL